MQATYRKVRGFPRERTALRVAYRMDRNHSILLSKRPDDLFYIDQIRDLYRRRKPAVRFVLTMRDPRAILTSVHAGRQGEYYVTPERWRATYRQIEQNLTRPDCLLVRFEDLVTAPLSVQASIEEFVGERADLPFDRFMENVPPDFQQTALNGLRAIDPAAAGKWREPQHVERLGAVLRQLPELPDALITMGYEKDRSWAEAYLRGATPDVAV